MVLPRCSLTFRPLHERLDVYRHAPLPHVKRNRMCVFIICFLNAALSLIGLPCVCTYWCCSVCQKVFTEVALLFLSVYRSHSLIRVCSLVGRGVRGVVCSSKPRPPHYIYIFCGTWHAWNFVYICTIMLFKKIKQKSL